MLEDRGCTRCGHRTPEEFGPGEGIVFESTAQGNQNMTVRQESVLREPLYYRDIVLCVAFRATT